MNSVHDCHSSSSVSISRVDCGTECKCCWNDSRVFLTDLSSQHDHRPVVTHKTPLRHHGVHPAHHLTTQHWIDIVLLQQHIQFKTVLGLEHPTHKSLYIEYPIACALVFPCLLAAYLAIASQTPHPSATAPITW